jgi:hypothetical protein
MSKAKSRKRAGQAVGDGRNPASADPLRGDPASGSARKTEQIQAAEAELVAYYRPIGIAAVAAAFALRWARLRHDVHKPANHSPAKSAITAS